MPNIAIRQETYEKMEGALKTFNFYTDRNITIEDFLNSLILEKVTILKNSLVQRSNLSHPFFQDGKLTNHFRQIARQQNLKASEISEKTGIDKSTLSYILSNKAQPGAENLLKLWVLFGKLDLEQLFEKKSCPKVENI
jgi:DNA-binding phage protein